MFYSSSYSTMNFRYHHLRNKKTLFLSYFIINCYLQLFWKCLNRFYEIILHNK